MNGPGSLATASDCRRSRLVHGDGVHYSASVQFPSHFFAPVTMAKKSETNVPSEIRDLVAKFAEHRETYHRPGYNEMQLRQDFPDPFLEAMGKDMIRRAGFTRQLKYVRLSNGIRRSGQPLSWRGKMPITTEPLGPSQIGSKATLGIRNQPIMEA